MRSKLPEIRQSVAALRLALLAPQAGPEWAGNLEGQIPALQEAVATLEQLRHDPPQQVPSPDPGSLCELSKELRVCAKLIARGLACTQALTRLLAPPGGAYRPDGEPVLVEAGGTVRVRG